ncbi:MAG: hypothetical protein ABL919_02220 [Methylococcales bacterium]|nr:hypothetical protein [Methylococcaceae bacterium]
MKALTRPMACAVLLSFLYLRFAQQLNAISRNSDSVLRQIEGYILYFWRG